MVQGTISVMVPAMDHPGATISVPVMLALNSGVSVDALLFGLRVAPTNGGPAVETITFASSIGAPSLNDNATAGTVSVMYFNLTPALTGTRTLGILSVPIPSGARAGHIYSVTVLSAQATIGTDLTPVFLVAGTPGSMIVIQTATSLTIVSGNIPTQNGALGTTLLAPFVVQITDAAAGAGNPIPNVAVTFTVTGGGGKLGTGGETQVTVFTDANGQASATLTLGTTEGTNTVTAQAVSLPPVTFTATAVNTAANPVQLVAAPTQVSETMYVAAGAVLQRTITVSTSPNVAIAYTASVIGGGAWIRLIDTGGALPGTISFVLDPSNLTAGAYTAWISISSQSASTPVTVAVSLTVKNPPGAELAVSPASLTFAGVQGGANPDAATIFISNTGVGTLSWTATSTATWLSVDKALGVAPAALTVSVNSSGLAVGSYQGSITIKSGTAQQAVSVTLALSQPPVQAELAVTPANLTLTAVAGSTAMQTKSVAISSSGAALSWTATVDAGTGATWLTLPATTGTTPSPFIIQVNPTGLAAGQYAGVVSISAPNTAVQAVNVMLQVSSAPEIVVQPTVIVFAGKTGGAISSQTLNVSTAGGESISFSATLGLPQGQNWLLASPTSGTSPQTLTLTPDTTGLAAGNYTGTITVTSSRAGNQVSVPVVLQLAAAGARPTLNVSPGGVLMIAKSSASLSRDVQVSGSTGASFSWGVVVQTFSGGNWLTTTAGTSSGDGKLTIIANPAGLAKGVYTGEVRVVSSDTVNASVSVSVFLLVTAGASGFSLGAQAVALPTNLLVASEPAGQFMTQAGVPLRLEAYLVSLTGNLVTNGDVSVEVSNEANPVVLKHVGSGLYTGSWTPQQTGAAVLDFAATGADANVLAGTVTSPPKPLPVLSNGGAVNAASFASGLALAPGSIVALFGSNLAAAATGAPAIPLPKSLGNVSVTVNGVAAPLFYVSSGQLNVQIPYELAGQTTATLRFATSDGVALLSGVPLASVSPGIFLVGATQGAIIHFDGRLANASAPASAGEGLSIYATGLGPVTNPPASGSAPALDKLSETTTKPTVLIGGQSAEVTFSGLAPTLVGCYQLNVKVPAGVSGNSVPVVVRIAGSASNTAYIAVQ
jgi:uncharacterized protein (TIGR03437 family)